MSSPSNPALPSYDEELAEAQTRAVRTACLLAGPLLVAFTALDLVLVPEGWGLLLALRLGATAAFLVLERLLARGALDPFPALLAVVILVMVPIDAAVLLSGGVESPYVYSAMLPMAGAALLVPLRPWQAGLICLLVMAVLYLPVLGNPSSPESGGWAAGAAFLVCMAALAVAGAMIHQRVFRREYEARYRAAQQAGLANLGMVAAGLRHELANPLFAITMSLERMQGDPDLNGRARRDAERIAEAAERMRGILDAMRSHARAPEGASEPVHVAQEIESALLLLADRIEGRVQVHREIDPGSVVQADRTLVGQVLVNLLLNAIQAAEGRPPPRWVALRVRGDDTSVVVEVEDSGPGVPEEIRDRIFTPLYTTKGASGTGLGLWLSAEIARAHGGSLVLEDGSTGGALFRLTLPVEPQPETSA